MGCPGSAQEGFPKLGQLLGSQGPSAARDPFLLFARIKTGKHLVPMHGHSLSSRAREQLRLLGLPSLHFVQNQGCVLLIFKSEKGAELFYLQLWGGTSNEVIEVIPFFFFFFVLVFCFVEKMRV